MSRTLTTARGVGVASSVLIIAAGFCLSAQSQTAPAAAPPAASAAAGPSPARAAIEVRKAVYVLIGSNFRPLGNVLKGTAQYDAAEAQKSAARIAFLSGLVSEAFPDVSNVGEPDTKAKADIWLNRADFDKKVQEFQTDAAALVQVNTAEQGSTDGFKAAVTKLGQDCKNCHDAFKAK